MAFRHGRFGNITINTKDLSTFLTNIDFSIDLDTADATVMGTTWKSSLVGIPGGKLELTGNYDPTAVTGPGAVLFPALIAGVPVTGLFYPGGNTTGQILWTITTGCLITAYSEGVPVGGAITFKTSMDIVVLPVRTVI